MTLMTNLDVLSTSLKAYLPPDASSAVAQQFAASTFDRLDIKDPEQRGILLALVAEAWNRKEDLAQAYERLGAKLDPKGHFASSSRGDRAEAHQALGYFLGPHAWDSQVAGSLGLKMITFDVQGHDSASNILATLRTEAGPIFPAYLHPELAPGEMPDRTAFGMTHTGHYDWPTGVPTQSVHDLERFIAAVEQAPGRYGVASLEAFGRFVDLYRSTPSVKKTKHLVPLAKALSEALGIELSQPDVAALQKALGSTPRMPLADLIYRLAPTA